MQAPKKAIRVQIQNEPHVDWLLRAMLVIFIFVPILMDTPYDINAYFIAFPLWVIAIKLSETGL